MHASIILFVYVVWLTFPHPVTICKLLLVTVVTVTVIAYKVLLPQLITRCICSIIVTFL